jgi:hypothetical protein
VITSHRMKGTLEPSALSIIPNPRKSNFLTIPLIVGRLQGLFSFSIPFGNHLSKKLAKRWSSVGGRRVDQ